MKKVAVFGNAGGGKSALAQRLAALTGLPLYVVDMMRFRPGGAKVPHDEFSPAHADILRRDEWIIDGFGNTAIAWERLAATVTLIHVDLPLFIHFRWITKRLIKGLFADPARLARKQSAMEQLRAKLSGALALPPAPHTRVPPARHGGSLHRRGRTT
jgi:adenylate kinase family enzyme